MYVITRKDLPIEQIAVQSCHAALEAPPSPSSLIILTVKNKHQLEKALAYVHSLGLSTTEFFEPDWDYGFTSFAVEPLTEAQKPLMKRFQLWKV